MRSWCKTWELDLDISTCYHINNYLLYDNNSALSYVLINVVVIKIVLNNKDLGVTRKIDIYKDYKVVVKRGLR